MENHQTEIEKVYQDRNQAVMALAKLAQQLGHRVGISKDQNEPDWPVLMVDLPTGQVGWHIHKDELLGNWPKYNKSWDGHNDEKKSKRIKDFLESGS